MQPLLPEHLAEEWHRQRLAAPERALERQPLSTPDDGDVLLVGLTVDEHLDAIEHELTRRGAQVVRIDADRWPSPSGVRQHPVLDAWNYRGVLCRTVDGGRPVPHHAERSVQILQSDAEEMHPARAFALDQSRQALLGLLDAVRAPTWINDPWAMMRADVKARQLRVAAREGLRVPRTLISDDAMTITAFADEVGSVVCKALGDPLVWEDGNRAGFLYTSEVTDGALAELGDRTPVPGIFQERLAARAEHRVTVVGDRVLAARVLVDSSALDWRRSLADGVPFVANELEPDVADAIGSTVAALGLRFAAVDLLESDDGLWFLEVNPSGAYGWLERLLDLPITGAICDLLLANA